MVWWFSSHGDSVQEEKKKEALFIFFVFPKDKAAGN